MAKITKVKFKMPDGRIVASAPYGTTSFLIAGQNHEGWKVENIVGSLEEAHEYKAEIQYLHIYDKIEIIKQL